MKWIKTFEGYDEDRKDIEDILTIARDEGFNVKTSVEITRPNKILIIENTISSVWVAEERMAAPKATDDDTFKKTCQEMHHRLTQFGEVNIEWHHRGDYFKDINEYPEGCRRAMLIVPLEGVTIQKGTLTPYNHRKWLHDPKMAHLHESVKFKKKQKKKNAKTDVYDVTKGKTVMGQIKWSSRVMGYAFSPTKDCEKQVKDFVKDLMAERRKNKKKKK